ncbi:hypothetical protein RJ639_031468 [Escallonia herrerae]|uniref:Large ribosomal subunit protein bL12 oligomerization domain-containing protein n=1 Tax=Escallonia herrerae TaxID=1293975 RepID=A0AA88X7C4_9ASTE|nr:hypothetical protein RJ639_031468 [Escallonia herrerae]
MSASPSPHSIPPASTDSIKKAVFLVSELSLVDALKLVEYLQDKLNITIAAFGPVVIVAPGTTMEMPAIVGEKTEFDIVFERWG